MNPLPHCLIYAWLFTWVFSALFCLSYIIIQSCELCIHIPQDSCIDINDLTVKYMKHYSDVIIWRLKLLASRWLTQSLFRRRSKKIPNLHIIGLCEGIHRVAGEFPAQRASNAENVSTWWRQHEISVTSFISHQQRTQCEWCASHLMAQYTEQKYLFYNQNIFEFPLLWCNGQYVMVCAISRC